MARRAFSQIRIAIICLSVAVGGITNAIAETKLVTLSGNVRPEATSANDRGKLASSQPIQHAQLLLTMPAASQTALVAAIKQMYTPGSPTFHHWLTAAQFGAAYGPTTASVNTVTSWLTSHGMTVNGVQPSHLIIDFSGTASQINAAFQTEMHAYEVGGARHMANASDPKIPESLSGIVHGVVSLNDFRPHPKVRARPAYTFTSSGSTYRAVVPGDLATIYNLNPLFSAGISGQGQSIVVIEDTNVYSTADWSTFRAKFGLSGYTLGSLTQVQPSGASACANPGTVAGNEVEAELDAEWASAAAPNAAIVLASCADTTTTFGGLIALENLVNSAAPPAIVSISYGECETLNGATANAAYNAIYQQAVTEGTSIFVAAGDEGAASCDAGQSYATHGITVSGFASTPYNVAVGGTDFADSSQGTNSLYWSGTNSATYASALSYVPEIPWNDSCASGLIATAFGDSVTYGKNGFCNTRTGQSYFLNLDAGSGGPSACATGTAPASGDVGGTCAGYAKPSWQSVFGNPADGVRDLPDVSLFAADGVWGHYYVFCDSDRADGGAPCTGAPSSWAGAGGTSFATPIMAGIQALVNQKQGSAQGLPTPVYYALAAQEYGASGSSNCNSSSGKSIGSGCVFNNVTLGSMDLPCYHGPNCYLPSGTLGVLSTSTSAFGAAYGTGNGWNFATGLGSVNAANLVNNW
jgi:subtilase family serine protease